MLYGNRETLSFVDLKYALLSKQQYDDDVETESGEGLVKRGRSSGREREGKGNNEKKPKKAAEVAIAKGDSDDDVYLAIDTKKSRDKLIVDSGCTLHMIPHRSWFNTYESFNGGNVYMRNHSICLVIGKGNIQVKMHDGVVRTITRVRHISDLKRNLIPLSTLEANGCGLYVLQGTVIYDTAGVATSKASLDDSKLWHYCLGHVDEKGMKNLAKKGYFVDYSNLRVFRCPIYVHVNEGKLVPRAVKCIFLGYDFEVKGYRVWCPDPKYRKIIHSRDDFYSNLEDCPWEDPSAHHHLNPVFILKDNSPRKLDDGVVMLVLEARGCPLRFGEVHLSLVALNPKLEVFYTLSYNQLS
nr:retrovirus-related Pol polyprotein from transposon TNT 1-94 [Tanacetum cinerariifolium]